MACRASAPSTFPADRLVIWTRSQHEPDLSGQSHQDQRVPLEIYMEGNVVFRQGERVIYATRMYYDVHQSGRHGAGRRDAHARAPNTTGWCDCTPKCSNKSAPTALWPRTRFMTSSRMGVPGYRVQSSDITFDDIQHPVIDPLSGQPMVNPATGEPAVEHERLVTGRNDLLYSKTCRSSTGPILPPI